MSEPWIEDYLAFKAQGHSLTYIAERFGMHRDTLRKRLNRVGISTAGTPTRRYEANTESLGRLVEVDEATQAKVRGLVEAHARDDADREFLLGALGLAS